MSVALRHIYFDSGFSPFWLRQWLFAISAKQDVRIHHILFLIDSDGDDYIPAILWIKYGNTA